MKWVFLGLLVGFILALCWWVSRATPNSRNGSRSSGTAGFIRSPQDSTVSGYRRQTQEHHHQNERY